MTDNTEIEIPDDETPAYRSLTTDAAIVAAPTIAATAAVALKHYLERPKPPPAPKIEQAPGYKRD